MQTQSLVLLNLLSRPFKEYFRYQRLVHRFPSSRIYYGVNVDENSALGIYTTVFKGVAIESSCIGSYSYLQENTRIYHASIGSFCSIAANVCIGLIDHPTDFVSTSPVFYDNSQPLPRFLNSTVYKPHYPQTTIGSDVWIGHGSLIKAGVSIGHGTIIGAGAIVTSDVSPYSIVVGVPARTIRKRFDEHTIARLLASKWWQLAESTLEELSPHFTSPLAMLEELDKFLTI